MNDSIDSVLNEVGRIISPTLSEEQKINTISQSIFNKVEKYCNSNNVNAVPIIGGSVAKGTWLKSNVDIDIFVRFSNDLDDSVLQDEGIKIGLNFESRFLMNSLVLSYIKLTDQSTGIV